MNSDWIEIRPDVCNGRPVLRGTRIAVQSILEMLAAGDSVNEVLEAFPSLRREQVLACVDHAARLTGNQYPNANVTADVAYANRHQQGNFTHD